MSPKSTYAALEKRIRDLEEALERARAEAAQGEASRVLSLTQAMAHVGSWQYEVADDRLIWSDETYRIFGLAPQAFAATYDAFLAAIHPGDRAAVDAAYRDSLQAGAEGYEIEHRVVRPGTGEIRHVHERCLHVRDGQGRVVRSLGMVQDITERRLAETALREAENRYRLLFDTAPDGIVILDPATARLLAFNETAHRQLGYTREAFAGLGISDIDAQETPADTRARIARVMARGEEDFETLHRTRQGEVRHVQVRAKHTEMAGQKVYHCIWRDITERKRIEASLRKSEETFRSIVESSPAALYLYRLDGEGRLILEQANPAADRIIGISHQGLLGETIERAFPALAATPIPRLYRQVAEGRVGPQRFEIPYRDERFSGVYDVTVFRTGPQSIAVSFVDITDRKRMEDALRESELRFRQIYESAQVGIAKVSLELRIEHANPALCRMLGYREEEIRGRHLREITHPDFWAENLARQTPLIEGTIDHYQLEKQFLHQQGHAVYGILDANLIRDPAGRPLYTLSSVVDITARKQAEEALYRTNAFLDSIIENIPDMVFLKDARELRFVRFNRAGEELVGFPREMLLGKNDYDFFPREQADHFTAKDREVLRGREIVDIPEEPIQTRDRGERLLHTKKVPIRDARGEPEYLLGISEDITERKRAEAGRRALEERLQRSERMESLGTLAGGVAHDLNNVLGVVVGYAEMLLYKLDGTSPLRADALNIMQGGERAAAIVQDLLALARRGVQTKQVLNLNGVIRECQRTPEFERVMTSQAGIRLELGLEADLLNILGSPVHLGKTILNLVANAVEAMPAGGVVTIRTTNQYLERPIQGYDDVRQGDYVVLSIADTGEGIGAGDIRRIFEPFYTKKEMGRSGTGLGLAVVWGTVKDHGGYIDVRSEEGRGTLFSLYFPVTRAELPEAPTAVPLSAYAGKGERLLVVDDVPEQRDLATAMLRRLNYQVRTAASGEEALASLETEPADLVVLDMIMEPGLDGLETYRRMSALNPGQKAVIVSGFAETDRVREAQRLGAGAYVRKPYILERLGLAVRGELDRSRAGDGPSPGKGADPCPEGAAASGDR